jgi:hypothetical protein
LATVATVVWVAEAWQLVVLVAKAPSQAAEKNGFRLWNSLGLVGTGGTQLKLKQLALP